MELNKSDREAGAWMLRRAGDIPDLKQSDDIWDTFTERDWMMSDSA